MIDPAFIDEFFKYIKIDPAKNSWEEMGLVDNAPLSAQIAFDHYLDLSKDAKQRGIEI